MDDHLYRALAIYRDVDVRRGEADSLFGLGTSANAQGRSGEAESYYREALTVYREIDDRLGEADTTKRLGDVASTLDRPDEATELYERALPILRSVGARRHEAELLEARGRLLARTGAVGGARADFSDAEAIYGSLGLDERAQRLRPEADLLDVPSPS